MSGIRKELEELGLEVKISEEVAEQQWRVFAREYRIVGKKAEALEAQRRDLLVAIMCGDVEVQGTSAGVAIKQFLTHPQNGGPSEITYCPPNAKHMAAAGADMTTIGTKWLRLAAALSNTDEGRLTLWLTARDLALMESIAMLFTMA